MVAAPAPLDVFISFAPEDEGLNQDLTSHLAVLQQEGKIARFDVGALGAGVDAQAAVEAHLGRAKLVLLLVSSDFLASESCQAEVKAAIARHALGEARVIPVLMRACEWREAQFGKLAPLPKNATPITSWPNRDEAFTDVVRGVREAVEAVRSADQAPRRQAPPGSLRGGSSGAVRPAALAGGERAAQVRHILLALADPNSSGVALLSPFGFGAEEMVEQVLRELARPGEPLLPVQLVPDPRSSTDERLYTKLLRDLRRALPEDPAWRRQIDDRTEASSKDRFELGVEDLLDGPVREAKRQLLFVVERLANVPEAQLVEWGMLMHRLSDRGLKLLAWGGMELHDLRTRPPSGGLYSAFHVLREVRLVQLSREGIERAIRERAGDAAGKRAAETLHELTGGHPALLEDLLRSYPDEVASADREALVARLLECEHVTRLRRAVEVDAGIREVLVQMAAAPRPMPKGRKRAEERLFWLGILRDAGPGKWDWSAPVMLSIARELGGS